MIFDSRTEHEVLPSFAPRYAVAVWFTRSAGPEGQPERAVAAANGASRGQALPEDQAAGAASGAAAAGVAEVQEPGPAEPAPAAEARATGAVPLPCPAAGPPVPLPPPLDMRGITRPGEIFVSIAAYRDSETQVRPATYGC